MAEIIVDIRMLANDADRQFYATLDRCMASLGVYPGEDCMEYRRDKGGELVALEWGSRWSPNEQRSGLCTTYVDPSLDGDFLWLWVYYSGGNVAKKIVVKGWDDPDHTERFQAICLRLHRALRAIDTQGRVEYHGESWFHFSKDVWRPLSYPDFEAEEAQAKAMAGRLVTWTGNAPAHWPTVVTSPIKRSGGWLFAHPQEVHRFADALQEAFDKASCDCRVSQVNGTWGPDGQAPIHVPIEVLEGQQVVRVFLYAYSTTFAAAHFAAIQEYLSEYGQPPPAYFAPMRLPEMDWTPPEAER